MSHSSKPRVTRRHKIKKLYSKYNYGESLPYLLEDFEGRCAYSLVHQKSIAKSQMHVDHHDPRLKRKSPYENLLPAYASCNMAKSDTWPSQEQIDVGIRFLDPCKEEDYGAQIFEDPDTHELVPATPAASYHIDILDLNEPSLVLQRKERANLAKLLKRPVVARELSQASDSATQQIVTAVRQMLEWKIPEIPPPPKTK